VIHLGGQAAAIVPLADPRWTPLVLAVLRRYHDPATFFTVGAHVAEYSGLVSQELLDGNEVGSHTYTHLDLATSGWRGQLELTLTQNALAGAAGIHTRLMRPPYSSPPDALTGLDFSAASWVGHDGYLVVPATLDTTDWARPGVARIVAAARARERAICAWPCCLCRVCPASSAAASGSEPAALRRIR
jgi:peptidoglycan/xylan/chitin deacetylase (PgdA/CDA1 family)